jgi:hypothetical protein
MASKLGAKSTSFAENRGLFFLGFAESLRYTEYVFGEDGLILSYRRPMKVRLSLLALASVAALGVANAQVIDGTAEALYGPALFTQSNPTQFGNSTVGLLHESQGGSEIDAVYGRLFGGGLNLAVAGNLENSFNKLVLFFDTGVGGFNTIGATQGSTDDSNFVSSLAGYTFDAGFNASHVLWYRQGGAGGSGFVTLSSLGASGSDLITANTSITAGVVPTITSGTFQFAYNHSNTGGVDSSGGSGAGVTTGAEMFISFATLGLSSSSSIRVAGLIVGGGAPPFASNQVIGGLPAGTNNLGGSVINFANIDGNQYVEVVPEPMTMSVLALGALAALRRRKSKKS